MTAGEWYDRWHSNNGLDSWRKREWYRHYTESLGCYGGAFLDVGCGVGNALYHAGGCCDEIHGVDISEVGLRLAAVNAPDSILHLGSGSNLSFLKDDYFDYVLCAGALEHFPDINASLSEMYRVGKGGCRYMVVVPNKWFPPHALSGWKTVQDEVSEVVESVAEWGMRFSNAGFRMLSIDKDRYHETHSNSWLVRTALKMLPTIFSYVVEFRMEKE